MNELFVPVQSCVGSEAGAMSHYEVGDWVDFVRGIVDGSKAESMSAHLKAGCAECLETYNWLQKIAAVASSFENLQVPEILVRRAQNIFERPPKFRFDTLFPLMAQVVVDAGRVIQLTGVRSTVPIDRSLYRAGDFTVDLRQESDRGSASVSLVGQISKETAGDEDKSRFPVAVFSGTVMLTNSLSNEFGEFSLTYARRPDLKLAIAVVETGRKIEIPLTRSAREKLLTNKEE